MKKPAHLLRGVVYQVVLPSNASTQILSTPSPLMKTKSTSQSAFFRLHILISLVAILSAVFLALFATSAQVRKSERKANHMPPWGGIQQGWIAFYNGGFGFDVANG